MEKKIVLITGATSGIGKAAALALAKQGFRVIIHGRNKEKTLATRNEIIEASGNSDVEILVADLSLVKEVNVMAEEFRSRHTWLDVLINNAGGLFGKEREVTAEGVEKTFAINVLAPFLLSQLLLDNLKNSPEGRIINVASNSHQLNARPDFTDLQLQSQYNPLTAYGNAKLFLIWNSQMLAKDLAKRGIHHVAVNSLHPGAVRTDFGMKSDLGPILNLVSKIARPFFKSAEQGADTMIYLATSDLLRGVSGKYFVNRRPAVVAAKYFSSEREVFVWDYCKQLTDTLSL